MDVAAPAAWTMAEFLAWEERQPLRWEFDGLRPVAMTGGTGAHEAIGYTLRALLYDHLRGKSCRGWGPTLKIEVAGRIRYPHAFVSCTPVAASQTVVRDPFVVFEVLSPGTSRTDRLVKLREYQATPSVQRYVILEQDGIGAAVFTRSGEHWIATVLTENDVLAMPEIGVELTMAAIYQDSGVGPIPDTDDTPG